MLPLILGVIAASVVGSMHCAGMCGPFMAFALGLNEPGVSRARAQAAYHGGRLLTYSVLGAAAGLIGRAIDLSGEAAGLHRVAATLAGVTIITFGLAALARAAGWRVRPLRAPRAIERLFRRGCDLAMRIPPVHRAAVVGMLTTLLPCGWLYSFAIVAAGTAGPLDGVIVMAAFWLGTLPLMVGLGAGIQGLAGPLRRAVPTAMALAIIAMGLIAVVRREGTSLAGLESSALASPRPRPAAPRGPELAAEALERIGDEPLPCCAEDQVP